MTELNIMFDKGYVPMNLNSINEQFTRLYGNTLRPTKFQLEERNAFLENKSSYNIERLPVRYAPTGDIMPSKRFVHTNQPLLSEKYTKSTAISGLSIQKSRPQPENFAYQLTPAQLREQIQNSNKSVVINEYSRSVPQRVSSSDRGLN